MQEIQHIVQVYYIFVPLILNRYLLQAKFREETFGKYNLLIK